MKFFIDTAHIADIEQAERLGILDGVTTNPSLMAKEGVYGKEAIMAHYKKICDIVSGDVSAEVIASGFEEMLEEGKKLAAIHPNIVVKVPMTVEGIKAIHWFSAHNIKTNCTLVFSSAQALIAAKAGATYVSPFVGRIDDTNWDGVSLIKEIAYLYQIQCFKTEILAASIRSSWHITACAKAGAHVCTCPLSSILGLFKHPLTDIGLEKFTQDAQTMGW